jgi:hypothetical protein
VDADSDRSGRAPAANARDQAVHSKGVELERRKVDDIGANGDVVPAQGVGRLEEQKVDDAIDLGDR